MVPACFTFAETPVRATGNWDHRIHAVYGTEPIPTPEPNAVWLSGIPGQGRGVMGADRVPLGPTTGHSKATGLFGYFTFSAIYPSLPQHFNPAGTIIHPNTTPAVAGPPPPNQVPFKGIRSRAGAPLGRVTSQPKPTNPWLKKVQGAK
jgi:hypothetical protein